MRDRHFFDFVLACIFKIQLGQRQFLDFVFVSMQKIQLGQGQFLDFVPVPDTLIYTTYIYPFHFLSRSRGEEVWGS